MENRAQSATTPEVQPAVRSGMRRALERWTESDSERDAEQLQEASKQAGATPAALCGCGQKVSVSGRLVSVSYTPRCESPSLTAELFDGSDTITVVWLGRRRMGGIATGRTLTVVGRLAMWDGRKVMYNPNYEVEPYAS